MLTISDRVSTWVKAHPFHALFMSKGLINASGLARAIRPELEEQAGERLSQEAITLALNRSSKRIKSDVPQDFDAFIGEVSVQSGMSILYVPQLNLDIQKFFTIVQKLKASQEYILFTSGAWNAAVIGKTELIKTVTGQFQNTIVGHNLVVITIRLNEGHQPVPGVNAYVLEKLALNGINLVEVASSYDELTVIIEKQYLQAALNCLVH